jgi:hypothetical protein
MTLYDDLHENMFWYGNYLMNNFNLIFQIISIVTITYVLFQIPAIQAWNNTTQLMYGIVMFGATMYQLKKYLINKKELLKK